MNDWLQLGLGGAALLILYKKQNADSQAMKQELETSRQQQRIMLEAVIAKDNKIDNLVTKIDKVIDSINASNMSLIQIIARDDLINATHTNALNEIKNVIYQMSEKFDGNLSKIHNRIDETKELLQIVKTNTEHCSSKLDSGMTQEEINQIAKRISEKRN